MKKGEEVRTRTWGVIFWIAALSVIVAYFSSVVAIQTIRTSTGLTNVSILEDRQSVLNISINNSEYNQTGNITGLTITLPSGLTFIADSQNTSANHNNSFTSSATVLNWSNQTYFLLNGSVDGGGTIGFFWFNVTVSNPGQYVLVVRTFNVTGENNYGNITVNVNDTTNGTARFVFPSNNTGTTSSTINISGNFTDNFNLSSVALYVWNSSNTLVNSTIVNTSATNGTDVLANFTLTFPREDRYFYNFLVNDTANNSAFNATNLTVVYDATRPLLEYNATGTEVTSANVSRNWTFVNATVTETNEVNITFSLYYTNGTSVNVTTFTSAQRTINWTNMLDGRYAYNITIADLANNRNESTTRNITVDTTRPLLEYNATGTEVTSANVSRNWTFVNATVTETNEVNITFSLYYTNGTSVNVTTFTSATRTINWTNLVDGRYAYNVTVTDYANNRNESTTRNITVDTTRPLTVFNESNATWGGGTEANYYNVSRNWIFVNATVTETNEVNITFTLYNGTGGSTNVTTFTDARRVINWTGLADGNYTYNVTVTDYANNRNTTATRTTYIDRTGPTVSLAKSSSTKTSLTLTISSSDATTGVNGSCTVSGRPSASLSGSTITESGLACSTSYIYDVACSDFAANSGSTSASFSTDSCSSGAGGGSGGGGGGGGGTPAATWTSTFVPEPATLNEGYTKSLAAKERVRVSVGSTSHHIGVVEVTATTAKVEVASAPQQATLIVGESKKFEVTNDSVYDLIVTLVAITSGKADIKIQSISEPFTSVPASSSSGSAEQPASSNKTSATSDKEQKASVKQASTKSKAVWVWGIVVVIVVAVALIVMRRRVR